MSEKDKPRIQWSAAEIVGIGIDNPERVRKTEDGKTVLMPTGVVDECDKCFGKLVDLDKMVPGVTYTGGKAHGNPDLPPCPKCVGSDGNPCQYKVTTFPTEDDPGCFEADVWDCPACGVTKIAEDCAECPGCLAAQPEGSVYRGRCWGMKLPENPKVSLADIPRREPKEEVCDHCGATYTGLFHCQSLTQIKVIDDSEFIGVISEWTPPKREVVPITPLDSHMVEGREMKVVREITAKEDKDEHDWGEIPRPISGIRDLVCRRCGVNYLDLPDDERKQADQQLHRIWKQGAELIELIDKHALAFDDVEDLFAVDESGYGHEFPEGGVQAYRKALELNQKPEVCYIEERGWFVTALNDTSWTQRVVRWAEEQEVGDE